jgi:hypothetical protein
MRIKKIKAYFAFASFLSVLFILVLFGPEEGWHGWMLWIAASLPFSLWVMNTIIEDNRERREEADRKVKELPGCRPPDTAALP